MTSTPANDAVAATPAPPGAPGHAEELDEMAELTESLRREGAKLDDAADASGLPAWRHGYPWEPKLKRQDYERTKRKLQLELLSSRLMSRTPGSRSPSSSKGATRPAREVRSSV